MATLFYDYKQLVELFDLKGAGGRKPVPSGEELIACCPFLHQKADGRRDYERNPSFAINLVSGKYNCYSCGAGGHSVSTLALKLGIDFTNTRLKKIIGQEIQREEADLSMYDISYFDKNRDKACKYLKSRGVMNPAKVAEEFHASASVDGKTILLPSLDRNQNIQGWFERDIETAGSRWELQPAYARRDQIFYGAHSIAKNKMLIAIESTTDCLWLRGAGYNAGATCGSKIRSGQVEEILKCSSSVCIIPQNDEPGSEWAWRLMCNLAHRTTLLGARLPEDVNDIAELNNLSVLKKCIKSAKLLKPVMIPADKRKKYAFR